MKPPNLLTVTRPPARMAEALCAEVDPDLFYPEKGGSTREAKQVCARCSVQAECLAYALNHDERFGIWGGTSERQRRRLKHDQAVPLPRAEQPPGLLDELLALGYARRVGAS